MSDLNTNLPEGNPPPVGKPKSDVEAKPTAKTHSHRRTWLGFFVTAFLLLPGMLWLLWRDYDHQYKRDQREFRKVEAAMNEHQMLAQVSDMETTGLDLYVNAATQKRLNRRWPIFDAFDSSLKIKQIALPELPLDNTGFRKEARHDRCITCHLGIERGGFDRAALTRLTRDPSVIQNEIDSTLEKVDVGERAELKTELEGLKKASDADVKDKIGSISKDIAEETEPSKKAELEKKRRLYELVNEWKSADALEGKLTQLREILTARRDGGEKLDFDLGDLPKNVTWLTNLTRRQIDEFAAHPRLDLFVDNNSPHPMGQFGCTVCHRGQGNATDFVRAAHSPATVDREEEWHKAYGWTHSQGGDLSMLSSRFIESTCLKCHHEVTDLVRHGSKQEAPKLMRGFELLRENGCFGCHEISGVKDGRSVGPDLRLEPEPALAYRTPEEQEKAKSDPLNMPGQYRKVGPSLRRIAEKTNSDWVRKWMQSPSSFRPDTKMPHFYGLSNNSPDTLPDDQKRFPDAEISSIAHYLMTESKGNLEGKDTTRVVLTNLVEIRQAALVKSQLADREWKELRDASRRLGELALISVPAQSHEINRLLNAQKESQETLQELHKKEAYLKAQKEPGELSAGEQAEWKQAAKLLATQTKELLEVGRIVPLSKRLFDEEGRTVELPKMPPEAEREKHLSNGRKLFTEKGCLACHSHDGTAKPGLGVNAAFSEANFGPNLSRLAAKIAPEVAGVEDMEEAKRRWIVQWVLNPSVYHPRTRMPVTYLTLEQAADMTEWLLDQKATDWNDKGPNEPTKEDLVALARVYLGKAPDFTRADVDAILPTNQAQLPGILDERSKKLSPDSDERRLQAPVTEDKLKWYIGRKAIERLGCYGCHDVPGFETAKPNGTALTDWGKKDAKLLAFEQADLYVRDHYNIVPQRNDPNDPNKPANDWHIQDGKPPYEKLFADSLDQHRREGFLHQKLTEARSFDFHRARTWDERLKMPQFRLARTKKRAVESEEAYRARADFEEAEAREAVMTFVLGLVAEPIPLKYLNRPASDRLAEVMGHQVLEKFNCAGCHQLRSGVYEFKTTPEGLDVLDEAYKTSKSERKLDHIYSGHNAWVGAAQTAPDRLAVYGTQPKLNTSDYPRPMLVVRLSEALRFTGNDRVVRNLPAAANVAMNPSDLVQRADPWGGTFTDTMISYMKLSETEADKARYIGPPPLIREGERVQPDWLYTFLLNPPPIRPTNYMMLRMPKFNMSDEDARALTNYFSAVSRLTNPGAGVTAEYVRVPQREEQYWQAHTNEYIKRLKTQKKYDERIEEMKPIWHDVLKRRLAETEASLDAAKQAVKEAKEAEVKKQKQEDLEALEARIKTLKSELEKKDYKQLRKDWEETGVYASDAYKLLTDGNLCLKCHNIGDVKIAAPQGPDLALTARRLQPEWVEKWIANPDRLFAYKPAMPQNFANDSLKYQDKFVGTTLQQVIAVGDILMDLPRVADLPGNRSRAPVAVGGGK